MQWEKEDTILLPNVVAIAWFAVASVGRYIKNGKVDIDDVASTANVVKSKVKAMVDKANEEIKYA